jgi:hypothetical protein
MPESTLPAIGTLYVDQTTGVAYRVARYGFDVNSALAEDRRRREAGESALTPEEAGQIPELVFYTVQDTEGWSTAAREVNLPENLVLVWAPETA